MTTKLIIYKSLLRDEVLVEAFTEEKNLSKVIYSRKELHGLYTSAWVNNVLIPPEDWHLFELNIFDQVHLVGQPQKGALPYVTAVAAAVVTYFYPPAGAAGWTLVAAMFKSAAIGYTLGSVADQLIFPPTVPQIGGESADPNYGWDGARLVTQPDGPVSVVYGQHRIGGTLIMQYVSTDGDKNYLHMLIALGEGPIKGIMKSDGSGVCTATTDTPDVEINGQAYSNYENCTWDYRLGEWDQTIIAGFHGTKTFYSDGRKISNGSPVTYTTTGTDIESLEIQLYAASLFNTMDNGDIEGASVRYRIDYKLNSSPTWINLDTYWMTGKSKTKIYYYQRIEGLTAGQYDIKITRESPDFTSFKQGGDSYLSGVTEETNEDIAYRYTALLALKIQATDQLSGTTPNVTVEVRGRTIDVPKLTIGGVTQTYDDCYWDDTASTYKTISGDTTCIDSGLFVEQWSKNPIWCTRDFVLNTRYGLGNYIDSTSFDTTNAGVEAKYCWELVTDFDSGTEHRFEMDLPISTYMSAPEAIKTLARTFRGWIIWSNGAYKPVIDRAQTAVWLFNSSNMFPKTLKTTYFKSSGIPNVVELQYADPDRNYNINTLEIVDEAEWTTAKPLRKTTIGAIGTVRTSQNLRDGKYYLNCTLYCTKALEFEVPEYLLHVEPGDTVRIANDLMAWGKGGRIVSATSSSITTNIDITYTSAYKVRVRLSDYTLEEKTVTSVTNNNRTLNISGTFTSTPLVDSIFTYGASDIDSKPFKVKTITRMANENYKLLVSEESSNKYADTSNVSLPDPKYTNLPNPAELPDNITDLTLTEMSNRPGFYISFNIPQNDIAFHHVDIFLSLDGSNYWAYRANVKNNSDIEVANTKPGVTYYIKAISYNHLGMANITPETASITTMDTNFRPPQVNGLRLDGESTNNTIYFTKKDAKFTWVKTSNTYGAGHLPAGQEALGAGQFFEEQSIKYWIEIWVSGSFVRKEIITENRYVYTYEKNLADNDGTPSSSFTIKVWGFNEHGNLRSTTSTDLAVSNPSPSVITSLTITGTGSTTAFEGKDINVSWIAPSDPDILNYKVIVTKTDDTVLRTEYSTDRFYTYAFDMNADDNSGTAINAVKINVYTQDWFSQLSSVTTISVTNPVPANVAGLTATALPRAVNFIWTRNSENDIDYYTYRIQVESDGWSSWINTNTNHISRTLTEAEIGDHTSAAIIYIEVKAVDTFENESATAASANATTVTMDIAATDIDDFAITASKNFTKIPILESDSWTNDSPSAGYVAWNEHSLFYNGAEYTIAAGNTDLKYIYWLNGLSVYNSSDTNPTLTDDDFVIAVNIDGTHDLAWNAIANQVIGSAYIEDASILSAKIVSLAANKIVADSLSAITANLGSITSGYIDSVEIVSSTFQTAASAKRIEITSDGITLHISDVTGKYGTNFKYGDGTKYGAGVLAYIQHDTQAVPFYIQAEQAVGDFHFFNRSSAPSGAAEVGDICVVNGAIKICTIAGTPGTWGFVSIFYDVKSYGATGNGSTDDTAAIQAAINAATAASWSNAILYFSPGVYKVSETGATGYCLLVAAGVIIEGAGIEKSIIITDETDVHIIRIASDTAITIRDLNINSPNGCTAGSAGIYVTDLNGALDGSNSNSRIYNNYINEAYIGIHLYNTAGVVIDGNTISNSVEDGIRIQNQYNGDEGDGVITNNFIGGDLTEQEASINWLSSGGFKISNNKLIGAKFGIKMVADGGGAAAPGLNSWTITNNSIEGNAGQDYGCGIYITDNGAKPNSGTIVGNQVPQGIYLDGTVAANLYSISIVGNTIDGSAHPVNNITAGINIADAQNITVVGNTIRKGTNLTAGIHVETGCVNISIGVNNYWGFASGEEISAAAGTLSTLLGSLAVGYPTGGDKGFGIINAVAVYDDNVLLTDYALEFYNKGKKDLEKWDKKAQEKKKAQDKKSDISKIIHKPAHEFDMDLNFNIDHYAKFMKANNRLPSMPSEQIFEENGTPSIGDFIQRLWETVEVQAIHIDQLNQRLKILEVPIAINASIIK